MKRRFGQHFLFDQQIISKIIACSMVTTNDTVIEIGPGPGTMTRLLAEQVKTVIAIEIDRKLIKKLKESVSMRPNIVIINADALRFPYETVKGKFKVVANIPYYITTPLLFRLLEFKKKIPSMTLLLQKEVAQRITASPGSKDYGVLSITTQLHTKPELKLIVSKGAFSPPPEVDSAVVHFAVYTQPHFKIKNEDFFLRVVKTAFSKRRKTIFNSLRSFKGIKEALNKTGVDSQLRPETLSIKDFIRLAETLEKNSQ
ncbi:MAG: ribosomal RNA small subunit methyltransferase A [Thermodesulfovibrionia bacterium]|nr:ribosomal RNA small subunit methyltransferase A [Thermodesulfovibrionia bacterium]